MLEFSLTPRPGEKPSRASASRKRRARPLLEFRGDSFVFRAELSPGANEIVLPLGYSVVVTSLPGQITTDHGLTKIGIVVTGNDASRGA